MSNFFIYYMSDNVCYVYFLKGYVETVWIKYIFFFTATLFIIYKEIFSIKISSEEHFKINTTSIYISLKILLFFKYKTNICQTGN